jgi:CubicO group peptidase (beta-lactamase class C family)
MKNFIFSLFLLFSISIAYTQTDARFEGVEDELNAILEVTNGSGFAVAVVEKNKIIYSNGFGYRDYENRIPADANTLFAIGSSTKAFTSALLGLLRKDDKLKFSDSPRKHIPYLKFYNDEMNNSITIKDMMTHRTGLPRHDFAWYLFPSYDKDSLLQRVQYQEPFTGVRERWYYNNFMFLAQGVIAEKITGDSWEANIKEQFFKPLEMNRSNLSIKELEKSENAALGYGLKNDSIVDKLDYYRIAGMAPAGSINSSVNEMSNWMITWLNSGKFNEKEIIPSEYVAEAMGAHMVVNSTLPDNEIPDAHLATYGYGWFVSSYKGHYRVDHGGNIDGFSANVALYPTDSIGIVVLANQSGSSIPGLVRNTIADRLLKTNKTDWRGRFVKRQEEAQKNKSEVEQESGQQENTKPSHIKLDYTGTYSNSGYGEFEIDVENDSLYANFKLMKLWLKHYHYDIFQPFEVEDGKIDTSEESPLRFSFITNDTGDISGLRAKIEPTLDPILFKRTPSTIEVDGEQLKSYVGEYNIAGTTIKVYTKNEDVLFLFVTGQPEYELIATGKHKFAFKIVDGFKVEFLENDNGEISELLMIQPQGNFKASKIE